MARIVKPLTFVEIENAKPKEKDYKLIDGYGLFLFISRSGNKVWRFRYKRPYTNKETDITIGRYPQISLADARASREHYRKQLAQNIDPKTYLKEQTNQKQKELFNTFEKVAEQWFEYRKQRANFSDKTAKDTWRLIERNLFPTFAKLPISSITAYMAIEALKPLQQKGTLETLKRSIQKLNEIMVFAQHRDLINQNPTQYISREFDSPQVQHMKTIKPDDLGEFIQMLYKASIKLQTRYLILWQLYTLTRPAESATAKWSDIDIERKIWTIYISKGITTNDLGREQKITLSEKAIKLLGEIKKMSGNSEYLFPSIKDPSTHVNTQTANAAIKRMGYHGKLVAHGLRSIASTALNEEGFNPDLIEVALSHINKDRIRMAYNRADYLEKRFEMLNWWGAFIESKSANIY